MPLETVFLDAGGVLMFPNWTRISGALARQGVQVAPDTLARAEPYARRQIDDLNKRVPRVMGVLRPLRVVIENYPEGRTEEVDVVNNPEDPSAGTRKVPFSRVLYIEREDFRENPPRKYFRLSPGSEVRRYDRLFNVEEPGADRDFHADLNPRSLEVIGACKVEPSVATAAPGNRFQFERMGYFCVDPDARPGALVFNRTVTLKDSWAKLAGRR